LFELLGEPAGASRSSLAETIVRLGNHARNLLCMTRDHLARSLNVLSGDEIFFHGQAIKVLLDPCSSAVVDVMRWPWRGSDEWALFLEPFSALRLFVTDDGADLRGANTGDVWLGADMFHERQWWNKVVFTPLDRREKALASELEKLRKRSDPSESYDHARRMKIARTEQDRQRVEALFYVGVEIEARLLTLFEPLDPAGARWDVDAIYAEILWATEQCSRLGASLGARVCKHIERRTPQYAGHHRLWDLVNVEFLPGATWSREQVLDALIRRRKLRAAEHHPERSNYERWRAHERRTALDSELSAQISNPDEAAAQVKRLLKTPARSSSLVETFNSRLRVLQTSRRNVSDALLWLCALHWNLSRRENGPRKHQSPWQQLGLIAQNDMRSWAEILLDMMPE
jgi:hypothetical protein